MERFTCYRHSSILLEFNLARPFAPGPLHLYLLRAHLAAILFFRSFASVLYAGTADPSQIIVFISYLRIVMSGGKKDGSLLQIYSFLS